MGRRRQAPAERTAPPASTAPALQAVEVIPCPPSRCDELRKSYGSNEAVKGVSFAVEPGEVFALLGPNGAGKTTTLEILEGFRQPHRG